MNTATDIDTDHFGGSATGESPVDRDELRQEVQAKYAAVADAPDDDYHFHTGRFIAERCGDDMEAVDALPDAAVESFAGVANPFDLRPLEPGERVVDLGSGAGFDSFLAANAVGPDGSVVGVDMTPAMLTSNGVVNLCPDKSEAFREAWRVLKSGGILQFADIANGRPVPAEAQRHIDLWTG